MRIEQAYISGSLSHFAKDFLSYWKLKPYSDPNKPALFLGLYNNQDRATYLNHKAFRLLQNGSIRDYDKAYANLADGYILPDGLHSELAGNELPNQYKRLNIAIKDYSPYKLKPLGNSIYLYSGINGDKDEYYNADLRNELLKANLKYISISNTTNQNLIHNIYPQTYCYLKNKIAGGNTTKWELMLMGRECIEPNPKSNISLIERCKQARGNNPQEIRDKALELLTMNDKWLYLSFY